MIPNGLNPHGLETRTMTFHTIVHVGNNVFEDGVITGENGMYCWATFPKKATDISTGWTLDSNISTQAQWNSCTKYTTKGGNNQYMVEGNVHFYYHEF